MNANLPDYIDLSTIPTNKEEWVRLEVRDIVRRFYDQDFKIVHIIHVLEQEADGRLEDISESFVKQSTMKEVSKMVKSSEIIEVVKGVSGRAGVYRNKNAK